MKCHLATRRLLRDTRRRMTAIAVMTSPFQSFRGYAEQAVLAGRHLSTQHTACADFNLLGWRT